MNDAPTLHAPGYFDRLADVEERHWWARGMWQIAATWLARETRGRRGLAALDVGCGTGLTAVRLAALPAVSEVVGVEPSRDALAHAGARLPFELVRGSALALPFEGGRFDLVTCLDVLQHLEEGAELIALREIYRVLCPGGRVLLRANGRGLISKRRDSLRPYRLETLRTFVSSAGLEVVRATYANCLPAMAQELRGRLLSRRDRGLRSHPDGGGLQIRVPPPPVNLMMGAVAATEALVAGRLHRNLPFGHSTLILARRVC